MLYQFQEGVCAFSLPHHFVVVCKNKFSGELYLFFFEKNGSLCIDKFQIIVCSDYLDSGFKLVFYHSNKGFESL